MLLTAGECPHIFKTTEGNDATAKTQGKNHIMTITGTFDFNGTTIDFASLPEPSLVAMIRRGLAHYLGNEQASKITGKIRTAISTELSTPDHEVNQVDVTKEQVAAFRLSNSIQVEEWKAEVEAAALAALAAGTVGQSVRGPSAPKLDPLAAEIRRIAKEHVKAALKKAGIAFPTGEKTVSLGGKEYTAEELVSRAIARNPSDVEAGRPVEDFTKLAKANIKARERLASKASDLADLV
jgi:hypothetical protein